MGVIRTMGVMLILFAVVGLLGTVVLAWFSYAFMLPTPWNFICSPLGLGVLVALAGVFGQIYSNMK